jgi:hypothetical protein
MGRLLIKRAFIYAHNNPKYTPIKDATIGLTFFATPHHGGDWMLVSLRGVAAKIATAVGFQKGDDVLETVTNGSIFSDIMKEHWRNQLLKYDIVSFWGALDRDQGLYWPNSIVVSRREWARGGGEVAAHKGWYQPEH